jgi:hypothetical protein
MIQKLVTEGIEPGIDPQGGKVWLDTTWKSLKQARDYYPKEIYREVTVIESIPSYRIEAKLQWKKDDYEILCVRVEDGQPAGKRESHEVHKDVFDSLEVGKVYAMNFSEVV